MTSFKMRMTGGTLKNRAVRPVLVNKIDKNDIEIYAEMEKYI